MEWVPLRPTVKICGLVRRQDVRTCVKHGTDIIGFVVDYPRPVPWNISPDTAKKLINEIKGQAESCIVTGGAAERILELALDAKPDYIQLHYGESLEDTAYIAGRLIKHKIRVVKTLFPDTSDIYKAAKDFAEAGVYALLLDPRTPDNAVTGGAADISVYKNLKDTAGCPVILAGGINPENVKEIAQKTGAPVIDLMTGVELSPGIKDDVKVAALFQALHRF